MTKRIIYVNSNHEGGRYLREAVVSARSFRRFVDDCEIVLYTNEPGFRDSVFDEVTQVTFEVPPKLRRREHKNGQMLVKHQAMIETTAERNLVLGSDTLAVSSRVRSAFDLLDRFDLAAAHAPTRVCAPIPGIPDAWPELNCDVVFFRKSSRALDLLTQWARLYREDLVDHPHDQGAFRKLTYLLDARIAVLPFEFNDRMGLFGVQARPFERTSVQTVIIQNREVISKVVRGEISVDDLAPGSTSRSGCWWRGGRDRLMRLMGRVGSPKRREHP